MEDKQETKKQHYVPRAFLTRWCNPTEEFYPIKIEAKTPPLLKILNKTGVYPFCHENYFYANHQGERDDLSQKLEASFTEAEHGIYPILDSFEKKVLNSEQITFQDKYELATVMLFLHLRGKKHLEWSKDFSNDMSRKLFEASLQYKDDKEFEKMGVSKEFALEYSRTMTVDFGTAHHLKQFEHLPEFAHAIASKYWKMSISRKGEFIVTDTPYLDLPVKQEGFWGNDIFQREQIFMLSPKVLIMMLDPTELGAKNVNRKDITNDVLRIDNINVISLMNSIRFGFHSDEKILLRTKEWAEKIWAHRGETESAFKYIT